MAMKHFESPPSRGTWIEMYEARALQLTEPRRPPRGGRGLKYIFRFFQFFAECVAPLAGAWIEISPTPLVSAPGWVAPLAGAWIEMRASYATHTRYFVAPLAGGVD